ncbi:CheB methylesterase domain-containing protein [Roseinatronobacter alkalisoli]|uniref:protein-glutamate methylesterase n=1 Tax=Roseinatronobacter alkalisoli TaxID=3028235 RepID=A0ABT5TBB7_9RHOB|nr:CheB methylesterase domain-containing protein [Roseinatronobacter sp. HJB301]MDD7972413.1 CheB methylesterase domain-containing protein [Roseinatronobacter sp. HJB301]
MTDPVILIADPNRARRKMLLAACADAGIYTAIDAGTLGETYQHAEMHMPRRVAVAAEFARAHEFDALIDMLKMISADLVVYGGAAEAVAGNVFRLEGRDSACRLVGLLSAGLGIDARPPPPRQASARPAVVPAAPPVSKMVMIGASTGGIPALETILSAFPVDCPPTMVVQHIRPGFAERMIRRLDDMVLPNVVPADDGMPLRSGTVYIAAGNDRHLGVVRRGGLVTRLLDSGAVSGHCPSVDVLFGHGAALAGRVPVSAAILTGMGADGAAGMRDLRAAGAYTVAQDKGSSVVWGMPRVAVELGGAVDVLPLAFIAKALLRDQARSAGLQGRALP